MQKLTSKFVFFFVVIAVNAAAQNVTGSGTANTVPVFTGTSTVGNSVIKQSSGNVGIGTGTPGALLEVNGNVKLTSGSGGSITFADGTVQNTAFQPFDVVVFGADPTGTNNSTTAVNSACTAAAAAGGGIVYFPSGTYIVNAAPICGSNLTFKGTGDGTIIINNVSGQGVGFNGIACVSGSQCLPYTSLTLVGFSNVTFEDLTFVGTVNLPPSCSAAYTCTAPVNQFDKTQTGTGMQWPIYIAGSLDTVDGSCTPSPSCFNAVTNVTVRRCKFRNIGESPLKMLGITGNAVAYDNEFYNTGDPGFIYDQNVQVTDNRTWLSGDNGFSITRGNGSVVVSNNFCKWAAQACYNLSGFLTYTASSNISMTGNSCYQPGAQCLQLIYTPQFLVVTGNIFDKVLQRGTYAITGTVSVTNGSTAVTGTGLCGSGLDGAWGQINIVGVAYAISSCNSSSSITLAATYSGTTSSSAAYSEGPTDSNQQCIEIASYNGNSMNYGNINGNTLYNCSNSGIYISDASGNIQGWKISNNVIGDTGTQYYANGTTAVGTTDIANIGIWVNQATYSFGSVDISGNTVTDYRATPYMNYSIYPQNQPSGVIYGLNNVIKPGRGGF